MREHSAHCTTLQSNTYFTVLYCFYCSAVCFLQPFLPGLPLKYSEDRILFVSFLHCSRLFSFNIHRQSRRSAHDIICRKICDDGKHGCGLLSSPLKGIQLIENPGFPLYSVCLCACLSVTIAIVWTARNGAGGGRGGRQWGFEVSSCHENHLLHLNRGPGANGDSRRRYPGVNGD